MVNHNTEYEKLVAEIHQGMLKYDGFDNLRVEHDVTLTGKSGATHQIDVFWEFKAAGIVYRTCIECKNYASAVKKSHVAAFSATLQDIGNANGIIATTCSFQKGAKLLAKQNNIRLVLVNHLIKTIQIKTKPVIPDFNNLELVFNEQSIKEALKRNNLKKYNYNFSVDGTHFLVDEAGNEVESINTILNKNTSKQGRVTIKDINLYLEIKGLGRVLVDSFIVDIKIIELPIMESIIESPHSANAVIEDIVSKNLHYLHDDGSVHTEPNA